MARARNIKPGFFKNEELVELPYEYRLLFIGLWTLADREGRLEDRPKRVKMEVFPADNVDVEAGLDALQGAGFIQRYSVGECQYIQVVNFTKHQNPHKNERPSSIPAPEQHSASTVQAPEQHRSARADSHDSHDSLIPDSQEKTPTSNSPGESDLLGDQERHEKTGLCDHGMVIRLYHQVLPELQRVVESRWPGSVREKALHARWRESHTHQTPRFWLWFFSAVRTNSHWMGRNDRAWKADLGWLLKRENFDKVIEHAISNDLAVNHELARHESLLEAA
jgi:hypothetical protein